MKAVSDTRPAGRARAGLLAAAVLTLALAACGDAGGLSADDFVERAREYRLAGDLKASVIELKNALQKDPKSAKARWLLGQIYVDVGDGASAEKELARARDLGMEAKSIVKPLGRALLLQRKFQDVLDEVEVDPNDSPIGQASVLALRGHAELGLRRFAAAEATYREALDRDPAAVEAFIGLARSALAQGDIARAEEELGRALAEAPDDPYVVALKGDVAFVKGDYETSEAAYNQLLEDRPQNLGIRLGLARAQIGAGKLDEAIVNLDRVLKVVPNHLPGNYLRALAAFRAGDYETTKLHIEKVLSVASADLRSLLLGGAANYAVGELEQAKKRLSRFLADVPSNEYARRLLGATLLRLARAKEALENLRPLVEDSPEDADLLTMIGTAAVRSGDLEAGSKYFQRAVELRPDDAMARVRLGATRVALGDFEQGIADFEAAVEEETGLPRAEVALIFTYLRARQYDKALAAAERLQERRPESAAGFTLAGMAYFGKQDWSKAKAAFEKAMEVRPGAPDAGNNLATLALREGDKEAARGYLEEVLKTNPRHAPTLIRLARMEAEAKNGERMVELLERAVEAKPKALVPHLLLARAYLVARQPAKALATAQAADDRFRNDPGLLEVTGKAQMALGRAKDAALTFSALARARPDSAQAQYLLGSAYEKTRDWSGVEEAARKALALAPDHAPSKFLLARLHVRRGEADAAGALIAELRQKYAGSPDLLDLEGVLALQQGRSADAVRLLAQAAERGPSTDRTVRLALARWRKGEREEAVATLEDWLSEYPGDLAVRFQIAGYYQQLDRLADAKNTLEAIVAAAPESWAAHNDLAWVLLKLGEAAAAKEHAERSMALAPDNPLVLDTLATVALEEGDVARARRLLEKALARLPRNRQIRFHLAQALARDGEKDEARRVLKDVLEAESRFPEKERAEALLKELGG